MPESDSISKRSEAPPGPYPRRAQFLIVRHDLGVPNFTLVGILIVVI